MHQLTLTKVDKLQQTKKEANHKLRNLRQQISRQNVERPSLVYDLTELNGEEDISLEELREELALLKLKTSKEDERLRRLVHGSGTGRPKSAEFEFVSRTILATGTHDPDPNINPCVYGTLTLPSNLSAQRLLGTRRERRNHRCCSTFFKSRQVRRVRERSTFRALVSLPEKRSGVRSVTLRHATCGKSGGNFAVRFRRN